MTRPGQSDDFRDGVVTNGTSIQRGSSPQLTTTGDLFVPDDAKSKNAGCLLEQSPSLLNVQSEGCLILTENPSNIWHSDNDNRVYDVENPEPTMAIKDPFGGAYGMRSLSSRPIDKYDGESSVLYHPVSPFTISPESHSSGPSQERGTIFKTESSRSITMSGKHAPLGRLARTSPDLMHSSRMHPQPRYDDVKDYSEHISKALTTSTGILNGKPGGRVNKQLKKPSAAEVHKDALLYRSKRLERDLELSNQENDVLKRTISQLKHQIATYDSSESNELQDLKIKYHKMMEKWSDITRRDDELVLANSQLASEMANMKSRHDDIERILSEKTGLYESNCNQIKELQASLVDKCSELEQRERDLLTVENAISSLREHSDDLKHQLVSLNESKARLLDSTMSLTAKLDLADVDKQNTLRSLQEISTARDNALLDVSKLREQVDSTLVQVSEMEELLITRGEEKRSLLQRLEAQEQESSEKLRTVEREHRIQLDSLRSQMSNNMNASDERLAQECNAHAITVSNLNEAKHKLNLSDEQILTLQKRCNELGESAEVMSREYHEQVEDLTTALKAAEDKLEAETDKIQNLTRQVSHLTTQKDRMAAETYELARCLDLEITKRKTREASLGKVQEELITKATSLNEKDLAIKVNNAYHEECQTEWMNKFDEMEQTLRRVSMELAAERELTASLMQSKVDAEQLKDLQGKLNLQSEVILQERRTTRRLQNQIQEMKGTIRLVARVRPQDPEKPLPLMNLSLTPSEVLLKESTFGPEGQERQKQLKVQFDRVFGPESTNPSVCEETEYLVQSALDGRNVSILAYGQTGSGKTWTMGGSDGIIAYALGKIMQFAAQEGSKYQVSLESVEIYNENIRDMLCSDPHATTSEPRTRVLHPNNKVSIRTNIRANQSELVGTKRIVITSAMQAFAVLQRAMANRSVGSTAANARSSRSHFVFSVHINSSALCASTGNWSSETTKAQQEPFHGVLHLVDLAGSERVSQSQVTGTQLNETKAINHSLSALGNVISALQNKSSGNHIPYRSSKLTHLLQGALSENAKTMLLTTFSPDQLSTEETKSTLRFAEKASKAVLK